MEIREIIYDDAKPVEGYGPGFFRIAGEVIEGAVIVTASSARSWAGEGDMDALTALAGEIDVILFGAGAEITALPKALTAAVEAAGMGLEPMASPAACRTYNVLVSEGRRVALAALPV